MDDQRVPPAWGQREHPLGILLVATDTTVARPMLAALEQLDLPRQCSVVWGAADARMHVARHPTHVAVVDARLPCRSALDLVADLRRVPGGPAVIIFGGGAASPDILQAWRAGAADYLVRPVFPDELRASVLRAARGRGLRHGDNALLPHGLQLYLGEPRVRPFARTVLVQRWEGKENGQIAGGFGCSVGKIKAYLRDDIIQPLGARDVLDCARAARDWCNEVKSFGREDW